MNIVSSTAPTLFGLPTTYSMWKTKRVDVGAVPLTFNKIASGIGPAIAEPGIVAALINWFGFVVAA